MGNELNTPITTKKSFDFENTNLKFGISEIQGWNKDMEDYNFYSTEIGENKDLSIFGIFDGHNGREISNYLSKNFLQHLLSNSSFKEKNYSKALKETFIEIDNNFLNEQTQKELRILSNELKHNTENEILEITETNPDTEDLSIQEIEQIKGIKEIFEPRNLENYNLSDFSGCCAIVILITNEIVYIANAGNCRCIPIDKNNDVMDDKTTTLHIIANEDENKRIKEIQNFKEKKIITELIKNTRGFGDMIYKNNKWLKLEDQAISPEPEIIEIPIYDLKFLIVGSHGLFDMNNNIKTFYNYNKNVWEFFFNKNIDDKEKFSSVIEEYFNKLIPKEKSEKGGMDNMTCLIIKIFDRPMDITNINKEENENSSDKLRRESFKNNKNNSSMKNLLSMFAGVRKKFDKRYNESYSCEKNLKKSDD